MPSGQPSGDRIIWDDANEKHLLLCILAEANPQKLNWANIATSFGKNLTSGAASQKYGKIKNRDKKLFENGGPVTAATPNGKANRTPKDKGTANGKAKQMMRQESSGGDDDDVLMETPSKKRKLIKQEEGGEMVDGYMDDDEV